MNSERLSVTKRAIFSLGLLILVMALLEFGCDFMVLLYRLHRIPDAATAILSKKSNDYLRARYRPHQRPEKMGDTIARMNSLGLRGAEPRDRALRIACIGDSVTFGWSASGDSKTYPYLLEQYLSGFDVDVINAGMPRWTSLDLLHLYIVKIAPLNPDVVVLMLGWNDIGYVFSAVRDSSATFSALSKTYSSVLLLSEAGKIVPENAESIIKAREIAADPILWDRLEEYQRILEGFASLVRANGSTPVLVTLRHFLKPSMSLEQKRAMLLHLQQFPDLSYTGWRRMITGVNERIRRVSADLSVALVDGEHSIDSTYFTDIAHLNDAGNDVLARSIARELEPVLRLR